MKVWIGPTLAVVFVLLGFAMWIDPHGAVDAGTAVVDFMVAIPRAIAGAWNWAVGFLI